MRNLLLGTALAVCFLPSLAMSNPLTVENVTLPYSETLNLYGSIDGTTINEAALAGQINITFSNSFVDKVWCDDLFHQIYLGSSGEQYVYGALVTDNSNNPSSLTTAQIGSMEYLAEFGNILMAENPSNQRAAEIQMAIWYVEYNSASNYLSFTGGTFTTQDVLQLIGETKTISSDGIFQLDALNGTQNEIDPQPVPEPNMLLVFGMAFFGIGVISRLTPHPT